MKPLLRIPTIVSFLGAIGMAACATAGQPVEQYLGSVDGACEAEKFFVGATGSELAAVGLPAMAVEGLLADRAGADGVEGTQDDALFRLDDARSTLGDEVFLRALKRARASKAIQPCGVVDLQLLAFNDFHGALEEPSGRNGVIVTPDGPVEAGGLKWLAAKVAELAATNPTRTVVVGAGDMIGATPLISAAFHDEPTIEGLALTKLAVTSVGNHEFDEGQAEIERIQRGGCHPKDGCSRDAPWQGAQFQYLAANVVDKDSNEPILPPFTIRRFGRVRVGFIGMTLKGTGRIVRADGVTGLNFLDEATTANQYAAELKALGVETIVVLLHEGGMPTGSYRGCEAISGPIVEIATSMSPDIDVIVSGHTHMPYVCEIGGKLVTSAAANGRLVTDIDLTIDERTGRVVSRQADNVIVTRTGTPHAEAEALVAYWRDRVRDVAAAVVGTSKIDLTTKEHANGQSDLGVLIADAHLFAESDKSAGGAQLAFTNGRGIRGDLLMAAVAGEEAVGEITFGEAFTVQPFQNELITMAVTGAQLASILEGQFTKSGVARDAPKMLQTSSNLAYTWRRSGPSGAKVDVKSIRLDGRPIKATTTYRVVMNAYLAGGGDDFPGLADGLDTKVGIFDIDALVYFFKKHSPIKAVRSLVKVIP